jgi:hypothetical protein
VVDEVDEPRRIVIRRVNPPVEAIFAYDLSATATGTTVRLQADIATDTVMRSMRRPLRRALARTDRVQLQRLKALIEASPET